MSSGMVVSALVAALLTCESIATDVISPARPTFDAVFAIMETIDNIDWLFIQYYTRLSLFDDDMLIGKKTKVT
jgi:hypothetical protein